MRRDAWEDWEDDDVVTEGAAPEPGGGDERARVERPARRERAAEAASSEQGAPERGSAPGQQAAPEQEAAPGQEAGPVRLLTVPESLRSVEVRVGGRAVRGMLLLAAVVLLVLGGRWWWVAQGAGAEPVVPASVAPQVEDSSAQGGQDDAEVSSAPEAAGARERDGEDDRAGVGAVVVPVVVHVVGEVHRPGVVELPAGARVADAVTAAGGLTEDADQASLNLARTLADGEQVWVGAPGEEPPPGVARGAASTPGGAGAPGAGGSAQTTAPPPLVDLNLATQADLEELPGIGPVTAGHILAWRDHQGRFTVVEELMEVSGIGERTFAQLQPLVTVGG